MNFKKIKNNRGFVILFAVTISSILLAIALGVANIALKEIKFGTGAKETNDSFFAADTGAEYALFSDKTGSSIFVPTPNPGAKMSYPTIFISGLGSTGLSCAIVNVEKDNISSPMATTVISKGYNVGGSALGVLPVSCIPPSNSIEREIKVSY